MLDVSDHFRNAIRAFTLNYGDPSTDLERVLEDDPKKNMAVLLKAWLLVLSNDACSFEKAKQILADVATRTLSYQDNAHYRALELAINNQWPSAVSVLDRFLMEDPHDLIGHQCALRLDGYQGRFHREAGRAARALPFWSKEDPDYGIMLSFYGFGLEELGDFSRAEDISREAAELEPYGYWPHHAVSHVLEMTGRPADGLKWMDSREALWNGSKCNNRVHIWWHKALFFLELGNLEEALLIYDEEILPVMRPVATQLCNPTALLWRLEILGLKAGRRWQDLLPLWQEQLAGMSSPFNEIHAAMAALRANDHFAYQSVLNNIKSKANTDNELAPAYREVAQPIVEAMNKFVNEDFKEALEGLLPVQGSLWRMGGSIAQRDIIELTTAVAAIRAGEKNIALSLINERLSSKPDSFINAKLVEKAAA